MTTSRSLQSRIVVKLTHNLLAVLAVIAVGMGGVATQETIYAAPVDVTNSTAALVHANDCWTGNSPADMAGVVPGHVVVTIDGTSRLGGEQMVGKALAQIFDGADYGLTVNAFCR